MLPGDGHWGNGCNSLYNRFPLSICLLDTKLVTMYDSIGLSHDRTTAPDYDFQKIAINNLSSCFEGIDEFGEYVKGNLNNLVVKARKHRIYIAGSHSKFYLGNNLSSLSKGDEKRTIEKISDLLHLPMQLATVTKIDIAGNIITKHHPNCYLQILGEANKYNRSVNSNGIYYKNRLRTLCFYNKIEEQAVKGQAIPELYHNRNLLRFEQRYSSRIRQQLKLPVFEARMLYDEKVYRYLLQRWKNEYLAIQKINTRSATIDPTISTKELIENLALLQIIEDGQSEVLKTIKHWQETGKIDKHHAQRHREAIKRLASKRLNDSGAELIDELTLKIKHLASNY
jgi:hypothetical protein